MLISWNIVQQNWKTLRDQKPNSDKANRKHAVRIAEHENKTFTFVTCSVEMECVAVLLTWAHFIDAVPLYFGRKSMPNIFHLNKMP